MNVRGLRFTSRKIQLFFKFQDFLLKIFLSFFALFGKRSFASVFKRYFYRKKAKLCPWVFSNFDNSFCSMVWSKMLRIHDEGSVGFSISKKNFLSVSIY